MGLRGLAPLRSRDFALYWAGLGLSQIGDTMETTATAWLLYDLTHSPILLGLAGAIRAIAVLAFGLVGGAVADRIQRRRILLVTQWGFAFTSLALGTLVLTGRVEVWHIYVFTGVNGVLGAFDAPARRSMFPTLVPRGEIQNAITLNGTLFRSARLAGAPAAGIIIATWGPGVAYLVNVASYAGILAALVIMRPPGPVARVRTSLMREVIEGPRYSFAHPVLRSLIGLEFAHSLFGMNTAFLTIIASDVLHTGAAGLGLLLGAQTLGTVTASAILVGLGDIRRKAETMLASGVAYAGAFAVIGFSTELGASLALCAFLGLTDGLWSTLRNTMFQLRTDDVYRGRTLSVMLVASRGGTQASQFETGLAVSAGGAGFASLLGAGMMALSLVAARARSDAGDVRRTSEPLVSVATKRAEDDAVV